MFENFQIFDEMVEIFCLLGISFMLRPRSRGFLFDLHMLIYEREMTNIIKVVKARAPVGFEVPFKPNSPFLVITPKGKIQCKYSNFMVANPAK